MGLLDRGQHAETWGPQKLAVQPGDPEYLVADSLLQNTWAKKDAYALVGMVAVHRVENPRLASAYEAYKASISRRRSDEGGRPQLR